jgi:error-prone DNA polymerase
MSGYTPLWCKSHYSFLEGASSPEELVATAEALELPALALTDRDGVYGAVRAHLEAKKRGVKLIIGSQLTVRGSATASTTAAATGNTATGRTQAGLGARPDTILLLVQNRTGYANLCRIISAGRLRSPKGSCSVNWEEICARASGLIALWHGRDSLDWELPKGGIEPDLVEAFAGRLYLMLPRHRREEERREEAEILHISSRLGLPLVAATEVLYHERSRKNLQDVLTCIRHNCTLYQAGRRLRPNDQYALRSAAQMRGLYLDLLERDPGVLERSLEIAGRCAFSLDQIQYRYPAEDLPDGRSSADRLRHLTFQGARDRYGQSIPSKVRRQLEKELALIEELDYCGYFLTMHRIVQFCRNRGILCQGRGSAANSAVCYCLGVTAVDPVRMELLFERFISRERNEPPDIDLDIEHNRREEVIRYVYDTYGRERAAMVANFIRYRLRSAVRDVGKVLGIPATTLERVARLLPHYGGKLRPALEKTGLDLGNPIHQRLAELSEEIQDFPRHLSIHPGGFLLGSEPVITFVPVENATMPERTVIQWDKRDVEDMNLFKVDLLGLGALTQLDYCFRLLKEHRGIRLSMADVPADDPQVFDMISRADTVGVFQIESRAQMAMLPRLKPRNYYDLVVEISIVRPGPIVGGMVHPFLKRHNGEEPVEYAHPSLVPILKKTLGVPLFQEQVMRLAMVAADYTPGEADQLRRDMAAWRLSGRIQRHRDKLIRRMLAKGIDGEFAERVYQQILGFGEYGFPESHAASFALIAYCTAWMKCHYPAEFACALLNAWPMGFYAPSTIVEDARRRGVEMRPIDVLISKWHCTLEPCGQAETALYRSASDPSGGGADSPAELPSAFAVRMGLRFVKGLGEEDWRRIQRYRKLMSGRTGSDGRTVGLSTDGLSVEDFVRRTGIKEGALAALSQCGALRGLAGRRREALWEVSGAGRWRNPEKTSSEKDEQQEGIDEVPLLKGEEIMPDFSVLNQLESIGWDYLSTGHSVEGHPLEPFRQELSDLGLPDARAVGRMQDGEEVSYAGMVICRQRPMTAGGVVFMTLEDESGFLNLVVWSTVFEKFRKLILASTVLGVTGKLQSHDGVVHMIVDSCWTPALSRLPACKDSRDFH